MSRKVLCFSERNKLTKSKNSAGSNMKSSVLKKIARQTFVDKSRSPHAKDLGKVVPLKIEKFDRVGDHIVAVGTDLHTGEVKRIARVWSRNPRNVRENPLIMASKTVQAGGVMLFTGVEPLEVSGEKGIWSSDGYNTIYDGRPSESASAPFVSGSVEFDKDLFLDPVETDDNGRDFQVYNIISGEASSLATDPKSFFEGFKNFFKGKTSVYDSVIIRAYSLSSEIASSIRVFFHPHETFKDAMERIISEDFQIEMVGSEEGIYQVSGRDLIESIGSDDSDEKWEIIPVRAIRKGLSPRDNALAEKLKRTADSLVAEFVYEGEETSSNGFRKSVLGLKHKSYGRYSDYTDIVTIFHEETPALPLSLVDTIHTKGLRYGIPGFAPAAEPQKASSATDAKGIDFSAYISELAEDLNDSDFDFLDPALDEIVQRVSVDQEVGLDAASDSAASEAEEANEWAISFDDLPVPGQVADDTLSDQDVSPEVQQDTPKPESLLEKSKSEPVNLVDMAVELATDNQPEAPSAAQDDENPFLKMAPQTIDLNEMAASDQAQEEPAVAKPNAASSEVPDDDNPFLKMAPKTIDLNEMAEESALGSSLKESGRPSGATKPEKAEVAQVAKSEPALKASAEDTSVNLFELQEDEDASVDMFFSEPEVFEEKLLKDDNLATEGAHNNEEEPAAEEEDIIDQNFDAVLSTIQALG